jgi:osmotically inducible protein OsmC
MLTVRRASSSWKGTFSEGVGEVSLESSGLGPFAEAAALSAENPPGRTSPMELLAAAEGSCICGTVAYLLEKAGCPAETLETDAEVVSDLARGKGILGVHVIVRGVVPGATPEQFAELVNRAKDNCPVSQALTGTAITVDCVLG